MPSIATGGRIKRLKQDLLDMKALSEKCPAIKFRTLDDSAALSSLPPSIARTKKAFSKAS